MTEASEEEGPQEKGRRTKASSGLPARAPSDTLIPLTEMGDAERRLEKG